MKTFQQPFLPQLQAFASEVVMPLNRVFAQGTKPWRHFVKSITLLICCFELLVCKNQLLQSELDRIS